MLTTAMKPSLVIGVFWTVVTSLTVRTNHTDVSRTTNVSVTLPQKNNPEIASTTGSMHSHQTATHAWTPMQHNETFTSATLNQGTSRSSSTDVTPKVPTSTYNLAPCLQSADLQQVNIQQTEGHLIYQSLSEIHQIGCDVILQVPSDKIVVLEIKVCFNMALKITERSNRTEENADEFVIACRVERWCPPLFSLTNALQITMYFPRYQTAKGTTFSADFSAVDPAERINLELSFQSVTSGYIQTPGWNGYTQYPPLMKSCVMLTPPPRHVIFVSFLSLNLGNGDMLVTFPGLCRSKRTLGKMHIGVKLRKPFFFPDAFSIQEKGLPLSFYFFADDAKQLSGFKVQFSFHTYRLKPRRVYGAHAKSQIQWNCSVSVWPRLSDHFPCDLVPQCVECEDEVRCPYTTEKCGLNKVEAGGRCYVYKTTIHRSWYESDTECRLQGALLSSLETLEEWNSILGLLKYANKPRLIWVGLKATEKIRGKSSLDAMYSKSWHWSSGSVAYYQDLKFRHEEDLCGQLEWKSKQTPPYKMAVKPCLSKRYAAILCELSSLSHLQHPTKAVTLPELSTRTRLRDFFVTCPRQHVTYETFACDRASVCRKMDNAEEWYRVSCNMVQKLSQPYFYCGVVGDFVPYSVVCDFRKDCTTGVDEDFCVHQACEERTINCGQGQCVDIKKRCDGYQDCLTNLDEAGCPYRPVLFYNIPPPAVVNFDMNGGVTMTPISHNATTRCPDTHFQCHDDGYCLPVYVRCNQVNDCPGHEDELGCENYICPGFYRCRGRGKTICLHLDHLCDGLSHCAQNDDELMCDKTVCPESCTCYGLAFTCTDLFHGSSVPQLRYLEARGSRLHQRDVARNVMLIHLGVQACGWRNVSHLTLPNLHSLDLSDNLLPTVRFDFFVAMHRLRRLSLAGNPIASPGRYQGTRLPLLLVFNLSRIKLDSLDMESLSAVLPSLHVLDLSESGIKTVTGNPTFSELLVLDLRGCPMHDFTPDFMKSMGNLRHIYAHNFKLCCPAVLADIFIGECSTPSEEISSCDDLLKSTSYRFVLAVFAMLSIFGNLGSIVYRCWFSSERIKIGYAVFVLHLCVSDLLMGVYLALIGIADRMYAGVYVWNERIWKQSAICSVAGYLSFLSSEVSSFLICLITLDRFLVLRFPFSQIRFGATSAHIACVVIWTLGLMLATVPLLPVTSHWEFYHQTGICIPLPVTRAEFAGHSYSFSVMIVCNLVLFVLIAVGQSLIYWSVRSNTMSEQSKATNKGSEGVKSKEAIIARRLLTIAMSDFLCWFPIGLCGLLAAGDVVIPGEVNVGLVVFVLPLNSALNPFLYTLNIILEKRQKTQEHRLQKFLQDQLKKI